MNNNRISHAMRLFIVILQDNTASVEIPDEVIRDLARIFLPKIVAMVSTEEGRKQLEEWKTEQDKQKEIAAAESKSEGR